MIHRKLQSYNCSDHSTEDEADIEDDSTEAFEVLNVVLYGSGFQINLD